MSIIPSIQVDFSQLMTVRNALKIITSKMKDECVNNIREHMDATNACWNESASMSFLRKEENIYEKILSKIADIEELIDSVEKEALAIFDAELYSKGLAINRYY